jgi:Protein of unknown function (DUF3102)
MTNITELPKGDDLARLAERIKSLHSAILDSTRTAVRKAIEAGELLREAKDKAGHGNYLRWLKENCGISERTAVRYMNLAAGKSKLEQYLRDKSAKLADMNLSQAEQVLAGKRASEGKGAYSGYQSAQTALLKKLEALPSEDRSTHAQATIDELQKVLETVKLAKAA